LYTTLETSSVKPKISGQTKSTKIATTVEVPL